jgi:hypothetical protein
MTARQESMPCLNGSRAQWDAETERVRYFANFDGTDEWIEIPGEDSRLVQLYSQEAIDAICNAITGTLDNVKATLAEFMTFRQEMEKLSQMTRPSAPEGTEN